MYAAQTNPRLSPTEAQILEAFLNPETTFLAVAKSLSLNLQELLDALTSPAIRAALDTLSQLDAIRRRLSLAPIVPGALNALTRLLDKSENLVEVRRAATTILSTYTRLERRVPRLPAVAGLDWPLPASTPATAFSASKSEIRRGGPCDPSSTRASLDAPAIDRYRDILAEREASRSSETHHAVRTTQPGSGADSGLRTKDSGPATHATIAADPGATPAPIGSIGPIGPTGPTPASADPRNSPLPPHHTNGHAAAPPSDSFTPSPLHPLTPSSSTPAQAARSPGFNAAAPLPEPTAAALAAAAGHAISVYALIPQPARAPPLCPVPPASLARLPAEAGRAGRPPLAHAA